MLLGLSATQISSCTKNKVPLPALNSECPDTIRYQTFVQPLISTNCTTSGCHDATSASGGYVFETYSQIGTNADIILKAIRHDGIQMPKNLPKLADSLATKLNCWIVQGKLEN